MRRHAGTGILLSLAPPSLAGCPGRSEVAKSCGVSFYRKRPGLGGSPSPTRAAFGPSQSRLLFRDALARSEKTPRNGGGETTGGGADGIARRSRALRQGIEPRSGRALSRPGAAYRDDQSHRADVDGRDLPRSITTRPDAEIARSAPGTRAQHRSDSPYGLSTVAPSRNGALRHDADRSLRTQCGSITGSVRFSGGRAKNPAAAEVFCDEQRERNRQEVFR